MSGNQDLVFVDRAGSTLVYYWRNSDAQGGRSILVQQDGQSVELDESAIRAVTAIGAAVGIERPRPDEVNRVQAAIFDTFRRLDRGVNILTARVYAREVPDGAGPHDTAELMHEADASGQW